MTRELSPKAGAALLRTTFAAKGSPITQTEALDLVAKLKGFNAWSHMQQHESKNVEVPVVPLAVAPKRKNAYIELHDVLIEHYGQNGECPRYPRSDWEKAIWPWPQKSVDYWKWVQFCADEDETCTWGSTPFTFKRDNQVKVTLPDGTVSNWSMEQNLTCRWGELNTYRADTKPGLAILTLDEALLEKLRSQMYDETTFIGRKDGEFGVYYEREFVSLESEAENRDEEDLEGVQPHAEVVAYLLAGITTLQVQFPTVQFCVPDAANICNDRPAVWAFVKSGTLSEAERETLGDALFKL